MKISWNWLNELLPLNMTADEAAILLTDIGLEVEGVYPYSNVEGGMEGLIVGEVISCEKHPDADKLKVTQVNIGSGELLNIVCGAPNVAAGQKVIVATAGTTVHPVKGEPFTIKKAKIRGVESNGMLCAEDEIGLGEGHDGLLLLPENTAVGIPVKSLFDIYTDTIIEIGLTANHADANSHLGTARELRAALISRNISNPELTSAHQINITINSAAPEIKVSVEDTNACPRYSGIQIKNVKVGTSPAWLQHKLMAIGMRPINNVVDITNYILHYYGQPLHAFDADKISGNNIVVKTLENNTPFVTLDGKERKLLSTDLMICDNKGGLCIAGVYGGLNSGVTETTTHIFLESAYFNPSYIRRTESAHGLKTDASARFAKGTDIEITTTALQHAMTLIETFCGGEIVGDIIDIYPNKTPLTDITLRLSRLEKISTLQLPVVTIKNILTALHIEIVSETNDTLQLKVPAYKNDVLREIDIIEEILRMHGFNNITVPSTIRTPYLVSPKPDNEKVKLETINYLVSNGFYEIFTNAISRSKYAQQFLPEMAEKQVNLLNSLNAELDSMRISMAFTGLEVIGYNSNHKQTDLKLFEFGRVYAKNADNYSESEKIGLFITGNKYAESWRIANRKTDFYDIKESVDRLLNKMSSKVEWQLLDDSNTHYLAPIFESGNLIKSGNQVVGICGSIRKNILSVFDIKQPVFFAEIDWKILLENMSARKTTFKEISKFPEVRRDLALVIDKQITYNRIEAIAKKEGKPYLKDVILFDVYEGEKLAGKKSYAIGLTFSTDERTLTDADVDGVMKKLMQRCETELGAVIRK
ncbi:MAG: phenylalanine--tRNA ligase subunit beta [Chitinophagales bacterium]